MGWNETKAMALETLRSAWRQEIERFAEELEPRFRLGEFHGLRDPEVDDACEGTAPFNELERLCEARFAPEGRTTWADAMLGAIASPSGEATADDWADDRFWLRTAAAYDVVRIARARGWFTPTPDEEPPPASDA